MCQVLIALSVLLLFCFVLFSIWLQVVSGNLQTVSEKTYKRALTRLTATSFGAFSEIFEQFLTQNENGNISSEHGEN